MPSYTLTDVAHDLWVDRFTTGSAALGIAAPHPWSVSKRTLRGGRRDGVDLIEVNNGVLSFSLIPTRGMGIWKGRYGDDRLGWDSPIVDGPVHPAFVNLAEWGGAGWLQGFDELLARCGLGNNGAPYVVKSVGADGSELRTTYGLHGKIANVPASFVAIRVGTEPPYEIAIEGHVDETSMFNTQIRMMTTVTTTAGSNRVSIRDEFVNLKDSPCELQVLYHWNFGEPYLEEGAKFVAPIKEMAPRDRRAQKGLDHFAVYGPPDPGFHEEAYYFELHSSRENDRTVAMLRNRAGEKGVALRFAKAQLPAFTLWKNTSGQGDGYVTGLEPGTNYPNPKPLEKARGRVVPLAPGGRYVAETTLEVFNTREAVAAVEAEINTLQKQAPPVIHPRPTEPFGPAE